MRQNPEVARLRRTRPTARRRNTTSVLLLVVVSLFATVACIPGQLLVSAAAPVTMVAPGSRASLVASAFGGTQPYTYEWSQTGGEAVTLDERSTSAPSFLVPDVESTFTFTVTVSDAAGATATASVSMWTDTQAPLVFSASGPSGPVEPGATVTLVSSLTGGRAPYRFGWHQTAGAPVALSAADAETTTFTMPADGGDLTFLAVGTDARGVPSTKTVVVTAAAVDPLALSIEGPTDAVPAGAVVELTSTVSGGREPYTYAWTQSAGTPVGIADPSAARASFEMPAAAGAVELTLAVTDARGTRAEAVFTVTGASTCGTSYRALWDAARAGTLFPADLGRLGSATAGTADGGATCDPGAGIALSGVSVDLLDGTITGTDLTGRITGSGLCLETGELVVRSQLGDVSVVVDSENGICLPIGELLAAADAVDAIGFPMIDGFTTEVGSATITIDEDGAHLVADGTPAPGGTAHADLDIALDGSLRGSVRMQQVPVFGTPVDLAGSVTAPAGGSLTGALTATVAGPVEVVHGLDLADVSVSLGAGGLVVSGDALLTSPVAAALAFTGTVTGADDWSIELTADGSPIELSDQVRLGDDLRLQVASVGGAVTGTGHATVALTVDGSTQTVVADLWLRADGALVVAATIDLAEWDLGTGSGHVWFATAPVVGFATGVPAIGTIDLPAGLTAGIAWDIPAEAYARLRDVVGLQLSSPTITVVASINTEDGFTATVTVPVDPEHALIDGVPGGLRFGTATLTITDESVAVELDGTAGSGGTATGNLVVLPDGSVTADLDLKQVPVFGHPLDFVGALSAPAGGAFAGSLTASVTGPIEVADGVDLSDLTVTVDADGVAVAGKAHVAGFAVNVAGAYADSGNWTLTIASGTGGATEVLDGLELSGDLTGTVTSRLGVVTFDVVAGDGATPVASWDLGTGHSADLTQVRVTNAAVPGECGLPVAAGATWLRATGALTLSNPVGDPVEVPMAACIDTASGAFTVKADAAGPIRVTDQVSLGDDLSLVVAGDGTGIVTGLGQGTVVITVDGKAQTVASSIVLRADGTLVVGASVDLAQWDLGEGTGNVWFATAAVAGFDTGIPAIGIIDLPAGLTAGVAFEIPEAAYDALRDLVGLQLSDRTITVVASITSEDGFTATVTVPVDPEHTLIDGVPGGLRFGSATLTITEEQVKVVLDGTAGSGGVAKGNLVVLADGSVTADLDLDQVPVFGQPLDLKGELSAPAGGSFTGSLTASLAGPVEVADGVELSDLTVTLDPDGVAFAGQAHVAGFAVNVSGAHADSDNWTLTITSGTAGGTEVLDGLELSGDLTGTVTSVMGAVTFDVVAGDGATPVASWDLGAGHRAELTQVRVTNAAVPVECGLPVAAGATWLRATGGLTLSNPAGEPVEIPMTACIDTATGAFTVNADADGPIRVTDQVSLGDDLVVVVTGDGSGTVMGTGTGTVVITVDGKAQTVASSIVLRADGTLIVGASVDLGEWDLGSGTGSVWFASADVAGFDTGIPAIGTIDLPAGLTAGVAFEIPDAAYTALRDLVGLQLTDRTITVVASLNSEDGFTATVTVPVDPAHALIEGVPGGLELGSATLTITDESVTVELDGTAGSGGTAKGNLVVLPDGSVTADLDLKQVPVFGHPLDFVGALSAPAGGTFTGSLTASVAGPIEIADGVDLSNLSVSLDADGVAFAGKAHVVGFAVNVSGAYGDADNWTATITSGTAGGTEVVDGLELSGDLTGTVTAVMGAVTFDVVAGAGAASVASWDLGAGHSAELTQVRVTNAAVPAECGLPVAAGATWLRATGKLTLSNPAGDPVEVPMAACIDTATGAFAVKAEADGSIALADQVSLGDDLSLVIAGDGTGTVTGTGVATVVITVHGKPQTVAGSVVLRANGTLIVSATVDLAEWGLGEGSGQVWFATAAVAGFETGDPAFGTIDLAAGLTAGISVTIPQTAYDALTNVVGLDLASPTVVLIASIGFDGSFSATMTVGTRPDSQISDGVPGGVQLGSANLHLTSSGFTVDVTGAAGDDGTVAVHLGVQADGAIDGSIELHRIPVLGTPLDLTGTLIAPAAGNLVVTVTADLPGPIEIAPGFVASNLHVRLDPTGTFVQGDARIGGETGPLVQVEGLITSDDNWAVEVGAAAAAWTPVDGLTLNAALSGTLRSTNGVVTFDLTAGNPAGPLATWDLGGGNGATLTLARVANVTAPSTCTVAVDPGDLWVSADGSLALGTSAGTPVNLPIKACVNVSTGGFAVAARSAQPIPLGRQVRIAEGLTLDLRRDGAGTLTGTGRATVAFTVGGTPQSVVADLALRPDGVVVIAARVDLAPWGLGEGNGYVWFATGAVPGFDTGDVEIGTIDLPAGLTIGVGVTIPESAFEALTGPLGLDLSSPTVVVVGSLTLDGELSATATVRSKPGHELVEGVPGGLRFEGAVLTLTDDGVAVSFDGTAGNGGTASADLSVGHDGSVTGHLELHQLPVFGHPVDLVGAVSAPAGGELTGSLTADVPGPVVVATGVVLHDIHLGLDASGLVVSAEAAVGGSGGTRVHVEGSVVDDRTWSLSVDASATSWTVVPGLSVGGGIIGAITSLEGVVTFDATAGTGSSPVATWDLGGGNGASLTTLRVANTAVSTTCPITVPAGDVWVEATGRITFGGDDTVDLPVHACVNAMTGAFQIDAATAAAIEITDDVRIGDDLSLTLSGDGVGTVTGTGHASVEITVDGDTQAVDADLALRGDGTFIVGATVDLAEWGLGDGLGHAWFATKATAGFETGDPALGTIDLPAGLTVAVSYTIPASAYQALTETLGLDLANPTLTVVASVTTDGSFEAVATVQTRADHELLPGVPGGVRLGTARVSFRDDAVVVDLAGTAGDGGTAEAHLTVTAEGAVHGDVDLHQVPVFGHPLDLTGTLEAPADGPITGELTAALAGPIVVSDQVTLFNLTVTIDETGVSAEGTAHLGGPTGPTVHVDGSFADPANWAFAVSTDLQEAWSVLPGVVINAHLSGTVSSVAGLVTFDVIAGAGSSGSTDPFATWDLGNGSWVELTTARISSSVAPASCGAEVGIGDVWVAADGRLSLAADAGTLDIPVRACIDVTTGAFLVTAATESAITLTDGVRLEPGLALAIHRGAAGDIIGAGAGTVTFTVDGTPQSVDATLSLRADGTFVIGAAIDLADWGMGQGLGQAWFATHEVADFDTGDPALGSIDLPAGITVGISFEMPDALYRVLADGLGLVVPSRTIAVVASVTADGSFRATAALVGRTDESSDVLAGIPGGVRIGNADLVFTDEGVTVDAGGETNGYGSVDLHLGVRNDGSMDGHVDLVDVSFFGTTIDLEGDVSAPVDGPLTGSLVADVPGPIFVSDQVELGDLHVAYDPTGLQVSGTARLGEFWGGEGDVDDRLVVTVDGTFVDPSNWSLTVTSTAGTSYDVTPDLQINATFAGTVTSIDGDIRFDVTAGNGDEPLVDWDLNGHHVILETARISNLAMSATCGLADEWYAQRGGVWVEAAGRLTFAFPGADPIDAPVHACVDVTSGAFLVQAHTEDPVVISNEVTIEPGMDLNLKGEPVFEPAPGQWDQVVTGWGSATATFTVNGNPQSITVEVVVDQQGRLVVSGAIDLAEWGLGAGTGQVWYASAAIPNHDAGEVWGSVPLAQGVTVAVSIPIPAAASRVLQWDMGLPVPVGTLTAVGQVGADGSFAAAIALRDIDLGNLLRTPGGATLDEAVLQVTSEGVVLDGHGTIGDTLGTGTGSFSMHLDVTGDGVLSGSIELHDLQVMDHVLDFSATVDNQQGTFHFRAEAALPNPIEIADGVFSVSDVRVAMDSQQGLELSAEVRVPLDGGEAVQGRLEGFVGDDQNWYVNGFLDLPAWTPFPELTIDADVEASIGVYEGEPHFELTVRDFVQWQPNEKAFVNFDQLTISNWGPAYSVCNDVVDPGHLWIHGRATAHLELQQANFFSIGAEACFDLEDADMVLKLHKSDPYPWDLGAVDLFDVGLELRHDGDTGVFTFGGSATGWINLDGRIIVAAIGVEFDSNGEVLLSASADLSDLVDARADAHVYYSSAPRPGFDTGDPEYGVIDLPQGVSVSVRIGAPPHIVDTLREELGVDLAGTELHASASVSAGGAFRLHVEVRLPGEGALLFTTSDDPGTATWLRLQELSVFIDTVFTKRVEVSAGGLLHFPAMSGSVASDLPVEASLSIGLETGDIALGVSTQGAIWHDAFGISGLNLSSFGVSGGIAGGFPQLGATATVVNLPGSWADSLGYQQGQQITLALNISLTNPVLVIELGTAGNTTPVLLPGARSGNPDAFRVSHAKLYIVPFATTIGGIDFPAGVSLALDGTVQGRRMKIDATFDVATQRLYGEAVVPELRFGNALVIRNLYVKLDSSREKLQLELRGAATFASINVIVDINIGNGTPRIDIRTIDEIPGIVGDIEATGSIGAGGQLSGSGNTQMEVGNILKDATVEMTDDGLLVKVPDFNGWEATATLSMSGLDLTLHTGVETPPFDLGLFQVGGGAALDLHVVITGDGWYVSGLAHVYVFAATAADGWKRHQVDIWGLGFKVGSDEICVKHPMVPWPICIPIGSNPIDQGELLAPLTTVIDGSGAPMTVASLTPDGSAGQPFVVVPESAVVRSADGGLLLEGAPVAPSSVAVVADEEYEVLIGD